jgi:predicted nucleotidyltransferase component of viral defense system
VSDDLEITERIKRLVIIAMVSDDELLEKLVLKGGNLLDIAYGISTRASVDIDFSVDGNLDSVKNLEERLVNSLRATFLPEGLTPFDFKFEPVPPEMSDDMKSFWGGYKIYLKIMDTEQFDKLNGNLEKQQKQAIRVGKRGSTTFTIDISNYEYCASKVARNIDGYTVFGYSPAMIVAEKLRAICQQMPSYATTVKMHRRARARDFVDIKVIVDHFDVDFRSDSFQQLLEHTFDAKRVPLHLLKEMDQYREYHRENFRSVQDNVKVGVKLASFDTYFDFVLSECKKLEAFWDK